MCIVLCFMWLYSCLILVVCMCDFFFFKQKTAYEMRISDWSSDVCSSDLTSGACAAQTPAHRVVPQARARMPLGEVGRMGGDLVGDDAVLHVLAVGQAQMLLRRDVAEHRRAEPADHRGADGAGDVVVARRRVGRARAPGVEGRLLAALTLIPETGR